MIKQELEKLIAEKRASIGVIGLGYVGLPVALSFGRGLDEQPGPLGKEVGFTHEWVSFALACSTWCSRSGAMPSAESSVCILVAVSAYSSPGSEPRTIPAPP